MAYVAVALGSNLGDPVRTVTQGMDALDRVLTNVVRSRLYKTAPMYVEDQPAFINAVVCGETELGPLALLDWLKQAERDHGRRLRERNGPRELDLDLVAYGSLVLRSPRLSVPHPLLGERLFVLAPLLEIRPDLSLPGLGTVAELASSPYLEGQAVEVTGAPVRV